MSNVKTQNKDNNNLDAVLALQKLTLDELHEKAKNLGLAVKATVREGELIDALVAKMQQETGIEPGELFCLKSWFGKDSEESQEAAKLLGEAKNRIAANEAAGRIFPLFLKNRHNQSYTTKFPGVRLSKTRVPEVLKLVKLFDQERQREMIQAFKDNPDSFQEPVLIQRPHVNKTTGRESKYVMLYLQPKQVNFTEEVF